VGMEATGRSRWFRTATRARRGESLNRKTDCNGAALLLKLLLDYNNAGIGRVRTPASQVDRVPGGPCQIATEGFGQTA
jgi:hypothetical protein